MAASSGTASCAPRRCSAVVPPGIPPTKEMEVICNRNRCFSLWEAEVEPTALALQQFEWGGLGTRLMDAKAEQLLVKAGEMHRDINVLLLYWVDMIEELTYERCALCDRIAEDRIHRPETKYRIIMRDVASRLVVLRKGKTPGMKEFWSRLQELKDKIYVARHAMESHYRVDVVEQAHRKLVHIKLSMRLVLREMMTSLGWAAPVFTACFQGQEMYVCKVELFPGHVSIMENIITITGAEMKTEADAVESAALAAILYLEVEKHMSHGELYVYQAEDMVQLATSLADHVFQEWNIMLDSLKENDMECRTQFGMHVIEGPNDWVYNVK
ncbi:hypothetical protein TRIUR3_28408 [Triticum urartu]|uniref:Uncharacterized protein n=1 Tax=Triticum urartu TaxID=4572 RepID=M7YF61_TRIUA|nr:hypothetical protein TRIUR3_28408 [Triticum urartu]